MIMSRGLTAEEKAKLARIDYRLSVIFSSTGHAVRVCEGAGGGDNRTIKFIAGLIGPPLISVPAAQFLGTSDEQFLEEMQTQIEKLSRGG